MRYRTSFAAFGSLLLLPLALTGCGGSSSPVSQSASQGRATVTLHWPARTGDAGLSRLIPIAANSIRVRFLNNGTPAQERLLVRPQGGGAVTSTTTFTDLPQGSYTVEAVAFPNANGSGVAQARATTPPVTITPGQSSPVSLTMGTTIVRAVLQPENISLTATPAQITAVGFDADNNIVLGGQWQWTNSNPNVVALVVNGNQATVAAVGAGQSIVTARDTESNITTTKTFDVVTGVQGQ